MATIKSENWDSVTPPAIPAGWTVDTQLKTSTTGNVSSPNALDYLAADVNGAVVPFASWATPDSVSGDVQVSTTFNMATTPGTSEQDIWIYARGNVAVATASYGTASYYAALVSRGVTTPVITLIKRVSGTNTTLATVTLTLADATNYRLFLKCSSTTISAQLERLSDTKWMNSSGVFGTDATTTFASVTDSSVAGAGYAGMGFYLNTGAGTVATDDFLFEDLTTPPPPPPPPAVDTAQPVKVFYGGSISF